LSHRHRLTRTYKHVMFYTYKGIAMEAKLTLKLDKRIIDSAKIYARKHNRSLSKLVENYFSHLSRGHGHSEKHSPVVESLSGILSEDDLERFAMEDERAAYIVGKRA